MKKEIIPSVNVDGKAQWLLHREDGGVIDLNKNLDEDLVDCWWQNDDRRFVVAFYSAWDSTELYAILNANGAVVKKGISEVIDFIQEQEVFIVRLEGRWLGSEQLFYSLSDDALRMAVLSADGKFLIEPLYERIAFDEKESSSLPIPSRLIY